jgi:hypothetical protein
MLCVHHVYRCFPAEYYYGRWHGIAHNYLLSTPDKRMIYSTPDQECVAMAYW